MGVKTSGENNKKWIFNTDTTLDHIYKERGETSLETPKNFALYLRHSSLDLFLNNSELK